VILAMLILAMLMLAMLILAWPRNGTGWRGRCARRGCS
jgi:hypothetical protein